MCGIFALLNYKTEEDNKDSNDDKKESDKKESDKKESDNKESDKKESNDDKKESDNKVKKNNNSDQEFIKEQFEKGQNRGPEFSEILLHEEEGFIQGFHRLAINSLTSLSLLRRRAATSAAIAARPNPCSSACTQSHRNSGPKIG